MTHDWFNGFGSLIGVVEWDDAYVVVENMRLDDAVENIRTDGPEVTINGGCGASSEVPCFRLIVG